MPTATLNVAIDTVEPRIARDRIVVLVDGRQWDSVKSTAYVDTITQTGMLTPLPRTPEWETTTTGAYARLRKADYTFDIPPVIAEGQAPPYPTGTPGSPDKWAEHSLYQSDYFLQSQNVNDRALTSARYSKNQPFYLAWYAYNSGKTRQVQIECGWLSEKVYIGLRIWTDGACEIYKNGTQVGQGNLFERKVTTQTPYGRERQNQNFKPKARKGDSRQLSQQLVDLLLIPCRRRDLLLLSNQGGGFRFTFEDLDPNNPDNEITGANSRFFWRVPTGQVSVQAAPLNFLTSGYLLSEVRALRDVPGGTIAPGETPSYAAYADQPGYGMGSYAVTLVKPDGTSAFVADGTANQCRIKVTITGDGLSSYWFYGASATFERITKNTDGAHSTNLTPFIVSNELSVPDNPADVCFKVTCHSPQGIEFAGATGIRTIGNRPVSAKIGSIAFLSGRSQSPSWIEGTSDRARRLNLEFRDRCKAMEEYRIKQAIPVDGLELAAGMAEFVKMPGFPDSDIDIPAFGFPLPTIGQTSEGEFALYPEVGDKALDWFTRLWENFARHTQWGWIPTATGPKFQVRTLDDLNADDTGLVLYPTADLAVANGISRAFAPYFLYRSLQPTRIECEANEIYVTGRDKRTAKVLQAHIKDVDSANPVLSPSQRPDNWLGEPRVFAWADPAINDEPTANWVAATLARRLMVTRDILPFDAFFQFKVDGSPIWRGDCLTLYGIGKVRITTLSSHFEMEYAGASLAADKLWRPTHYTSELVRYPTL